MKLVKWITITLAISVMAIAVVTDYSPVSGSPFQDVAAIYKAKCTSCHGAKAEKSFDTSKSDDQLLTAVLNGVKPKMPSYEKSLGADTSKALVAHMRQLRK